MRRLAREACLQPYDKAAQALNEDWKTSWDGKHIQRWTQRLGQRLAAERDEELTDFECGHRPASPANPPELLVISVDAGKVQTCDVDPQTGSRWRDNKIATVSTYVRGDGKQEPQALVTTHVATMERTGNFGKLVRLEAEKRGLSLAKEAIALGDGGNWIDPLLSAKFPYGSASLTIITPLNTCMLAREPSTANRRGLDAWVSGCALNYGKGIWKNFSPG